MDKKDIFIVIDDDSIARYILSRRLKKIKKSSVVIECVNGEEAFNFLKDFEARKLEMGDSFPPLIIFVDINMPVLNGFEFLDKMVDFFEVHDTYKESNFVLYSSSSDQADIEKSKSYSIVKDYLVKTDLTAESLEKLINKYI